MGSSWLGGASIFLLIVVHLAATRGFGKLLFAHRWSAEVVLVQSDEIAEHAFVELDGALVLRQRGRFGAEAGDNVVTRFAASDLVSELATAPVGELHVGRFAEQSVEAVELVGDGGVFERGVEDIHRLILACHAVAILPLVYPPPGGCRSRRRVSLSST